VKRLVILVAVVVVLAGGTAGALVLRHHSSATATSRAASTSATTSLASALQTVSAGCTSLSPLSSSIANSINISFGLAPGPQNVAGLSSFVHTSDEWLKVSAMGSVTSSRYSQLVADVKQLTTAMPGALQAGNATPLRPMAIAVTDDCAALGEIPPQSPPTVTTAPPGASYQDAHTVMVGCNSLNDLSNVLGAGGGMTPVYNEMAAPDPTWSAVIAMASVGPPYQQLAKATQLFVQFAQPSPTATVSNVEDAEGYIELACLNLGQSTESTGQLPPTSQATVPTAPTTLPVPSGSNTVTVPSVAGLSQAGAATVLGNRGLTFSGTTSQPSSSWPEAGIVIGSVPGAGSSVLSGSGVTLIVSSGPPPTTTTTTTPVPTTTTVP
jgi:hypothetical protein